GLGGGAGPELAAGAVLADLARRGRLGGGGPHRGLRQHLRDLVVGGPGRLGLDRLVVLGLDLDRAGGALVDQRGQLRADLLVAAVGGEGPPAVGGRQVSLLLAVPLDQPLLEQPVAGGGLPPVQRDVLPVREG